MRAREFIIEGGNIFQGRTSSIRREDIAPTLTNYFNELKQIFPRKADIFNTGHFHALGSVGKKEISGDIDLGIDVSSIVDKDVSDEAIKAWNLDPDAVRADAEAMGKRARTATPEQLIMRAVLRGITLYINTHAKNLYCDEKKVTAGNIFGLYPQTDAQGNDLGTGVQIDWMISDIEWLKFSYYSDAYPAESNVKGLCRTQLLLSAFQQAGLSFNHVSGVKDKETGEVIAKTPADAIRVLSDRLNVPLTQEILQNYYTFHDYLKAHISPDDYSGIINTFLKILDSTRIGVPDNLRDEWKARKDKLGLTGKFLPDDDPMRQYL